MRTLLRQIVGASIWLGFCGCIGNSRVPYPAPALLPDVFRTHAERTGFVETGTYAEADAFCRRLEAASPYVRFTSFGTSGEGRALPLLILSKGGAFTPEAARRAGKPIVLIQNCIHAGECEGKDASLALARDMVITGTQAGLLDQMTLLIIPIFNVDGHERRSPYSRINQNGPREMGWRTTATNINLNRDYMKADAIEMQAWLRLWHAWNPDFFVDNHTTDGHDHQYAVFYGTEATAAAPVRAWMDEALWPVVLPGLSEAGYKHMPYSYPRNPQKPADGIVVVGPMSGRYSTGYVALCDRPAVLVEAHALEPYGPRVHVTYEFVRLMLDAIARAPERLQTANRAADDLARATRGGGVERRVALHFKAGPPEPFVFRGVEQHVRTSEVTGGPVIEYTDVPCDVPSTLIRQSEVELAVTPPAAYLVPPQWTEVIQRLDLHGIATQRLREPVSLDVAAYRFEDVKFREAPFEGRHMATYKTIPLLVRRSFPAGTVVVPTAQARAKLAVHLLEPDAPDALVAWGLLSAIFEQKEYAEAYVMEPLAQQMLRDDAALREEFERRIASDTAFAADPGRRLQFLYERSPFWDELCRVYPIARVEDEGQLAGLKLD